MFTIFDIFNESPWDRNPDYGDAVVGIQKSNMTSWDKKEVIKILNKREKSSFYKAIIEVANSNMASWDKKEVIVEMCKEK